MYVKCNQNPSHNYESNIYGNPRMVRIRSELGETRRQAVSDWVFPDGHSVYVGHGFDCHLRMTALIGFSLMAAAYVLDIALIVVL